MSYATPGKKNVSESEVSLSSNKTLSVLVYYIATDTK